MREDSAFEPLGVRVAHLGPDRGFGGVATRDIRAGDILVRVPRSRMLTAEDARACPTVGPACVALDEFRAIALKLLLERAAGAESRWAPWLATLPDRDDPRPTHPLLWDRERRRAALAPGSPTLRRLESAKVRCARDRDAIADALDDAPECDFPRPTVDDVLWAASIINSRAFHLTERDENEDDDDDVEWDVSFDSDPWTSSSTSSSWDDSFDPDPSSSSDDTFEAFGGALVYDDSYLDDAFPVDDDDGSFLALVPWADALNHSSDAGESSTLSWDPTRGVAQLRAHAGSAPGDEVHDSYGPHKTRADLFVDYGFVPDLAPSRLEDSADIPGEWFWEEAEEAAAEEARDNDASNALKLLLLEEAAHGAPHRSALRSHLAAVGMRPEDTVLRVTPRGLGDAATTWCGLAVATRAELFAAGWTGGEAADAEEAWGVVSALMADESPAAIEREVRARGVLARLCSRLLRDYPSFAKYPSLAMGVGRSPRSSEEEVEAGGMGEGGGGGGSATGDAAAAMVLASEARALSGAIESFVGL